MRPSSSCGTTVAASIRSRRCFRASTSGCEGFASAWTRSAAACACSSRAGEGAEVAVRVATGRQPLEDARGRIEEVKVEERVSAEVRILLVDDHYLVRVGLTSIVALEPDMTVCAEASTGEQAVALYRECRPDVVLMDLRLPGISGFGSDAGDSRRVSGRPHHRALDVRGGRGDLPLAAGGRHGLPAQERPARGAGPGHSQGPHGPEAHPRRNRRPPRRTASPRSQLSPRELDVLGLVVQGKRNKEIASALDITEGTVKIHVSSILCKLGVSDRTEAVTAALQRGIVQLSR